MNIIVNCIGSQSLPWEQLKKYDVNSLKSDFKEDPRNVDKLKNSIIHHGFNFPFFIWHENKYIIDGAGRIKALLQIEKEGFKIPDLPIIYVAAKDLDTAKSLVLQASSQHGDITQESFDAFVSGLDLSGVIDSIIIPDVKMPSDLLTGNDIPPPPDIPPDSPKPEKKPSIEVKSQIGDIYEIGDHALTVGGNNPEHADLIINQVIKLLPKVIILKNGCDLKDGKDNS